MLADPIPMHRREWAQRKLRGSVSLARDCSRDYRETRDRRYLQVKREAMQDARYWRRRLAAAPSHASALTISQSPEHLPEHMS